MADLRSHSADAAAINSINLHYNRKLAAHTTFDDVVSRADLLDELGGTTLAKTLVPLLKLDKLKEELADHIQELNQAESSGSLYLPGEAGASSAGGTGLGLEGLRRIETMSAVEEEEGAATPRACTVSLPQLQRSLKKPNSCLAFDEGLELA